MGRTGTREADINLSVTQRIGDELKRHGISVLLTRTDDVFVSLKDRVNMANAADAAIFVSIHCNSAEDEGAHGTETYHSVGSKPGKILAETIHQSLVKAAGLFDRGVKEAKFYVLRRTKMPATLVELAFISNKDEEKLLKSEEFQQKTAKAIAEGIINHSF
ncbi:MAG TPA: N-acetylmuramoyl-L-alanine amidase [Firmicutes bacterium]|nr:N-acetylmuramoyl-L-alanine amidase [Bacillota bacterium]HHY99034.1 N-acetylmuramoyl-L-alanine amidase [Bacillota bacterium]